MKYAHPQPPIVPSHVWLGHVQHDRTRQKSSTMIDSSKAAKNHEQSLMFLQTCQPEVAAT